MRFRPVLALAIAILLVACSGGSQQFIDTEPAPGDGAGFVLWPGDGSLAAMVTAAEAVVVGAVEGTVGVYFTPAGVVDLQIVSHTTYHVTVEQWLKGSGGNTILLGQHGGIGPRGPDVSDGGFLFQTGRRYVLLMYPGRPTLEGKPEFYAGLGAHNAFEVTDGFVHVLSHPLAADFQTLYGGMPEDAFIALIQTYVANPVDLTRPTPLPTPLDYGAGVQSSATGALLTVAIDANVKALPANTRSSLGTREVCNTVQTADILNGSSSGANTTTTLNDAEAIFPLNNGLAGKAVEIWSGTGVEQIRRITANTTTQLTVAPAWSIIPDGSTSMYRIIDALYVDITVQDIPAFDAGAYSGGLGGVGFTLEFDQTMLRILQVNPGGNSDTLLAAGGPRSIFEVIDADASPEETETDADPLPARTGVMRVDSGDLSENFESGSGVLARLMIVGRGLSVVTLQLSDLTLTNLQVYDASSAVYEVPTILNAKVSADEPCSAI